MDQTLTALQRGRGNRPQLLRRLLGAMLMQRSRMRLRDLDDHLLRDIGLDRATARREADQPGWNAPDHWLR
jgi:uncharacterized protein YjiS (DUF1127 family)